MATTFGSEEFIIDASKTSLVKTSVRKIDRLFEVKIAFDVLFTEEGDYKQWLVVSGRKENRSNAKSYILAMCHPEQTTQVSCQGKPHLDDVVLEDVERKTRAYLVRTGSQSLQVMGSELACLLAISQLEQTYHITMVSKEAAENGAVSTKGRQPPRLAEQRSALNPSPTDMVRQVEGLVVDSPLPEHPDNINSHQLFASEADLRTANFRGHSSQVSRKGEPYTMAKLPLKRAGHIPEVEQATGEEELPPAMFTEGPVPDAEKRRAAMLSLGARMGYSQADIEETLNFFDFAQHDVRPAEFLCALDEVRANNRKEGDSSSPSKQGQDLVSGSVDAGRNAQGAGQSKKAPGHAGKKSRKGKPKGDIPEHSTSPSKPKAASVHGKSSEVTDPSRSDPGSSNSPTNTSSRNVSRDDSVLFMGEDLDNPVCKGKQQRNALEHSTGLSKPKATSTPGKSSGVTDPSQTEPGCSSSPANTGSRNLSRDDSVIVMGEDLDNSVCIVDAFIKPASAAGQARVTPPDKQNGAAPARKSGQKRKEYSGSEDEDETLVLRPYPSNTGSDIPASHGAKQQASNLSQAVRPIAIANQPSGTSTSTETAAADSDLRFIVIDGQNVAMSHGNDKVFSCKGIKLCVDYFLQRGHRVKAWVPLTMTYTRQTGRGRPVVDQHILEELKDQGYLGYTPARTLNGRHIVSHDDYFILNHAKLEDAVVVTKDNFREFVQDYRDIIENRLLSYVFTDDHFMLPQDPLGCYGPTLDEFLHKKTSKSVRHPAKGPTPSTASSDPSVAFGQPYKAFGEPGRAFGEPGRAFGQPNPGCVPRQPQGGQVGSLLGRRPAAPGPKRATPWPSHSISGRQGPKPLLSGGSDAHSATLIRPSQLNVAPPRHPNVTRDLLKALRAVFPDADQEAKIKAVLDNHPADTDLNKLVNYCINALSV